MAEFWLTYNNGAEKLRLPVNPESIRVTKTHGYDDILTTQLGELTVIGTDRLREYSMSSFFPRDYNPSYCEYESIPTPDGAAKLIERWMEIRKPIRLTITGSISVPVTVRSFSYEERPGHVGDVWYDITLKEYRFTELKKVTEKDGAAFVSGDVARAGGASPKSPYVVKSGDYLGKIAWAMYGKSDRWRDIYAANKKIIGPDSNAIKPGMSLVIPL